MNFTTYDDLKSTIEKWLMRPDLVDDIPAFIELAEAMLSRRLRTRQMVLRARIEAKSRYLRLPTGWRKAWNVQRVEDDFPLEYLSPVEMDKMRLQGGQQPCAADGALYLLQPLRRHHRVPA
jgi:hypothetical protein